MTDRERLLAHVETLTEEQAAETLRMRDRRTDPLTEALDNAPIEDEQISEDEEAAMQIARDEITRGETVSLEVRAELDTERR